MIIIAEGFFWGSRTVIWSIGQVPISPLRNEEGFPVLWPQWPSKMFSARSLSVSIPIFFFFVVVFFFFSSFLQSKRWWWMLGLTVPPMTPRGWALQAQPTGLGHIPSQWERQRAETSLSVRWCGPCTLSACNVSLPMWMSVHDSCWEKNTLFQFCSLWKKKKKKLLKENSSIFQSKPHFLVFQALKFHKCITAIWRLVASSIYLFFFGTINFTFVCFL